MTTVWIFLSLGLGMLIGLSGKLPKKVLKYNEQMTLVGVLLLLFVMGMSLGLKINLQELKKLGFQSAIFTVLTIFFSLLTVYILTKWALKEKKS